MTSVSLLGPRHYCFGQFHLVFIIRAVTREEVPEDYYPSYCTSIFYLFNPATAARIVKKSMVCLFLSTLVLSNNNFFQSD